MPDIPGLKAEFFKALGHPLRIRVLELLAERERPVAELLDETAVEQPALSQQLGVLRRAGFVVARRDRQMLLDQYTATRDELARS